MGLDNDQITHTTLQTDLKPQSALSEYCVLLVVKIVAKSQNTSHLLHLSCCDMIRLWGGMAFFLKWNLI